MSAEQVQAALVRLVRYPTLHRGEDVDAFVARYDLDPREEWQVRALASSFYVAKFGLAERRVRFDKSVRGVIPAAVRVMTEPVAERLFGERFEPAHAVLGVADIAGAFVRWFVESFEALRAELALPPWLADVARYEMAAFATFSELRRRAWRVPAGSVLRADAPFTIVELAYDVDPFVQEVGALADGAPLPTAPEKRDTLFLFARVPNADGNNGYRCAIDASVRAFLEAQRVGRLDAPRPEAYETLVALGLCAG